MGKDQLTQRILCSDSKVDLWKIRSGKLDDLELEVIKSSIKKLTNSPLFFNDMSSISLKDIRSQVRLHNAKSDKKIELLIVDYLQLMTSTKKTTIDQVTEITKGLKQIAKEFNIPVIALSQLSRAVEARGGKPRLSDLRDSGSIEQDADIVMFLHQDKNLEGPLGNQPIELLIEKHRNGATGDIHLDFNGSKMNFTESFRDFDYKQ
jgi:replicative DNA helicase